MSDFLEFKLWKLCLLGVAAFFYAWWLKWHRNNDKNDDQ